MPQVNMYGRNYHTVWNLGDKDPDGNDWKIAERKPNTEDQFLTAEEAAVLSTEPVRHVVTLREAVRQLAERKPLMPPLDKSQVGVVNS